MRFKVFDVGHGLCAYAVAENGNHVLFDCGHKANPERRPSDLLPMDGVHSIEYLFVTNYDEDHISDLPRLRQSLPPGWLYRNKTISPDELRELKLRGGPITPAMSELLEMIRTYTDTTSTPPPTPGVSWNIFQNSWGEFSDTNNLSLAVFLDVGPLRFLIPGDLEGPGWLALLESQRFKDNLEDVDVMIASHHGRESGYCREVFDHCRPAVVIFSDSSIVHASQEMADRYASHCGGTTFNGEPRKVISTRNDGDVWWDL